MKIFKRKRKGFGMVHFLMILGVIAVASAIVVPMANNRSELRPAKDIQIQATKILNAAREDIKQSDLPSFGFLPGAKLDDQIFNSIKVTDAVKFLNAKGALDNMSVTNLTTTYPALTLGDLKILVNLPAKDIIVDSTGNLTSFPRR